MPPTRVAALVIGNELLTGKVQDTNVAYLAKELFSLGAELSRVVFCGDDVAIIAQEVNALRLTHDWVITSGGVGPTHDDLTIRAVADAFSRSVVRSAELETKIRNFVGARLNEGHLRMADIPDGSELVSSAEVPWPTIVMQNVMVLPGLPEIFRMKLPLLRERVRRGPPFQTLAVYTTCRETEIAQLLDRLANETTEVRIGSYPVMGRSYSVRITFDGTDLDAITQVRDRFVESVAADLIVDEARALAEPPTG